MVRQFIKDLYRGLCSSFNGIGFWFGAVYAICFLVLPAFDLGAKVNAITAIIPLSWRLLILFGFVFISAILTSYSMYKKQQQKIEELQNDSKPTRNSKTNTKQEIRDFLESLNPEILQRIDAKEKVIVIHADIETQTGLIMLSKLPDFDKYLSFEKPRFYESYALNCEPMKIYHLCPKDALIK
jgi:hypothetical protein